MPINPHLYISSEYPVSNSIYPCFECFIKNTPALVNYKNIFHEITVTDDISDISSTSARKAIDEKDFDVLKNILHESTLKFI